VFDGGRSSGSLSREDGVIMTDGTFAPGQMWQNINGVL
jgi:hypothetical protein